MTPEERAAAMMQQHFGDAAFDPDAFRMIANVMAMAIAGAVTEEREACARVAVRWHFGEVVAEIIAAEIRERGKTV